MRTKGLSDTCVTCGSNDFHITIRKNGRVSRTCKPCNRRINGVKRRHINTGFTPVKYSQKLAEQENKCAICGKHRSEFTKDFAADHDHKTGKLRGLLCFQCNTALGKFNDDIGLLQSAIEYLKDYQ